MGQGRLGQLTLELQVGWEFVVKPVGVNSQIVNGSWRQVCRAFRPFVANHAFSRNKRKKKTAISLLSAPNPRIFASVNRRKSLC